MRAAPWWARTPLRVRMAVWMAFFWMLASGLQMLLFNLAVRRAVPPLIQIGFFVVAWGPEPFPSSRLWPVFPGQDGPALTWAQAPGLVQQAETLLEDRVIQEVRRLSLWSLALTTLASGLLTYWVAGRGLAPLRKLTDAVRQMDAQHLHARVPLPSSQDEIRVLAQAFNALLARIEQAFAQQQRFVSDAAHELRTPLATLATALANLQAFLPPDSDAWASLQTALRTQQRMQTLVGRLLILSRESSLEMQPLLLLPLVEDVLDDLRPLAHEARVQVTVQGDMDLEVQADPALLAIAMRNVLENAVRYNRPGGRVTVTLKRHGDWARISIADTGIGMTPEEQARALERFYRSPRARARHPEGSGLGLPLAAHILELHGGSLQLHSRPGEGTTVTLILRALT